MSDINIFNTEDSNRNFDDYLKLMTSLGHNIESINVMILNNYFLRNSFFQDDDKIGYNEILDGKYFIEKQAVENIKDEEKMKTMSVYEEDLFLEFEAGVLKSSNIVDNRKNPFPPSFGMG